MTFYGTAWTRRGSSEPLLHAITFPLHRYSRAGTTWVAECGAQVGIYDQRVAFDPRAERACGKCRATVSA